MSLLNTIALVTVAVLFAFPYIVGPFLIKFRQRIARRPVQQRYDPAMLSPEVMPYFYNAVQELTQCGFTVIDYVTKPGEVPNVTPYIVYLVNRLNGDMASIACFLVIVNGVLKIQNKCVFLMTIYASGEIVSTCTMPPGSAGSCYKYRPYVHNWRCFDSIDITELYKRHRFLISKYSIDSSAVTPEVGREVEAFTLANEDVQEYQVKQGILKLDALRDVYTATWFGAFYMTWALLWPCKQLRLADAKRKAERELTDYRRGGA